MFEDAIDISVVVALIYCLIFDVDAVLFMMQATNGYIFLNRLIFLESKYISSLLDANDLFGKIDCPSHQKR